MDVTNDLAEFLGWVRPGDVIAFDTLKAVSGLVQWADNAPVNHVGLMIDQTTLAMANEPPHDKPDDPVVSTRPLSGLLEPNTRIRAAQILRHPALGDAELRALRAQVSRFQARPADFAGSDMFALLPSAVGRSYRDFDELNEWQSRLLRKVIRAFNHAGAAALGLIPDNERTLTCSEFVYRCLIGAGLDLAIAEPLGGDLPTEEPFDKTVSKRDAAYWAAHREHNRKAGQAMATDAEPDADAYDPPAPERVTPGDFWRSPSLDPVGYYVKTPPR
jgi:hypothetical protein